MRSTQPAAASGGTARVLWLGWLLFVVYGSLVPLDFHAVPLSDALERFGQIRLLDVGVQGRGDWVSNGVLYVPVGMLTAMVLTGQRTGRGLWAGLAAFVLGGALALMVEFAQLYFPPRTVSLNDLLAEGLGCLVGVLLAWKGRNWLPMLETAFKGNWRGVAVSLVPAGVLAVLLTSLFPFDLLLSSDELSSKADSAMWGWWLAGASHESTARVVVRWGAEALVLIPLGALWARAQGLGGQSKIRVSLWHAFFVGAGLGVAIELGQWFIASGVSQGVSVLSRALGWMLGAWLWNQRAVWGVLAWRDTLRRLAWPLFVLYSIALMALNGWFSSAWRAPDEAAARFLRGEVSFVPFFYHYYTSEAVALQSLLSTALLYVPIGLLCWGRRLPARVAAWCAAIMAIVMEAGKLFPEGTRPDPTNVGIAALASALVVLLVQRATTPPDVDALSSDSRMSVTHPGKISSVMPGLGLAFVALLVFFWLVNFPVFQPWVGALLVVSAVVVWWRPAALVAVVVATLPLLNLSIWSGREYVDEFDAVVLVCLAVAYVAGRSANVRSTSRDAWLLSLMGLLFVSALASTVVGFSPWTETALSEPDGPLSPWNSWRLFKGVLWASALFVVVRAQAANGLPVIKSFAVGMVLGLLAVVSFVLWERVSFVGLWDNASHYRVAGPVLPMRLGGAYLDAFLVSSLPFALVGALYSQHIAWRTVCALAALGASYAIAVTFTRTTYFAAVVGGLLVAVASLRPWPMIGRARSWEVALLLGVLLMIAYPFVSGPFAQARLAAVNQDFETRLNHAKYVLRLAGESAHNPLWGLGLGRFPAENYWARSGRAPDIASMAVYRFRSEQGTHQVQLWPGPQLFLDQIVAVQRGDTVKIVLRSRAAGANGRVQFMLCEKWLLASDNCTGSAVDVAASEIGWSQLTASLKFPGATGDGTHRPVRLSLSNVGPVRIDIDTVSLQAADGMERLRNGGFEAGGDHWTYTSDDHLAWHVKNMPLAIWFDMGWLGVMAFSALIGLALLRSARAAWVAGDRSAIALFAALSGLMIVSVFDSIVDESRFLLLLLMLVYVAAMVVPAQSSAQSASQNFER